MPTITQISEQKRRKNRRNVYLDGVFAFACNQNVVRKFALVEGMTLDAPQVAKVLEGEVQQECFDRAMRLLERRMHSRVELRRKLARHEYGEQVLDRVLQRLTELKYLDDEEFARQKVRDAQRRLHGKRSAMAQLLKAGVKGQTAREVLGEEYSADAARESAQSLITKQIPRLRRLDLAVAKRRLLAMLQRRGFDYESVKPLVDAAMGAAASGESMDQ